MAKQAEYRFSREKRQQAIAACNECNGSPETAEFNLQGMCGRHCTKCLTVVDWVRLGTQTVKPTVLEEVKVIEAIPEPIGAGTMQIPFESIFKE